MEAVGVWVGENGTWRWRAIVAEPRTGESVGELPFMFAVTVAGE